MTLSYRPTERIGASIAEASRPVIPSNLAITVERGIKFSNDIPESYLIATVTGGVPPYTLTSDQGLPTGLDINGSKLENGSPLINQDGIFTISGTNGGALSDIDYTMIFTVTDAVNSTVVSETVFVQVFGGVPPVFPPN
jgi:hypothetical protein